MQVGEVSLYYEEHGSGRALVFICGLGGDHRAFSVPARRLAEWFRVVVLDPRDAGSSSRASRGYTTAEMAEDVAGLLRGLEAGPAYVVGHSLGGLVAQELAIQAGDLVRGLVLASTHAQVTPWRAATVRSWVAMRRVMGLGEFTRHTLPWLVAPDFFDVPARVEGLVRYAEKHPSPQDADAFTRQAEAGLGHDSRDRLAGIVQPTLVLGGALDLVNPPEIARGLAESIPGAVGCELLEGVGHLPHVEQPLLFREHVERFLRELEAGPAG